MINRKVVVSKSERSQPTIGTQSGSVEVEIHVPEGSPRPVERRFHVDPALVKPSEADLKLALNGFPFEFPARYLGGTTWSIEFPKNVLELLSKEGQASYSGTFRVRGAETNKELHLEVILNRGTIESAG